VSWRHLAWVLNAHGREGFYRTWEIHKRRGLETRTIRSPQLPLYEIQVSLLSILNACYKPTSATHGFIVKRSILSNARVHENRRYVLNVDLVDFFPSINFGRVRGLFHAAPFNCTPEVATLLAHICCSGNALPIGAPTSPVVSNMICRRLDKELILLARQHGARYSRYADDLTFSTRRQAFPPALATMNDDGETIAGEALTRIIEDNGFVPNATKTRLQSQADRQLVTGLVVNRFANIDRRYIRRTRSMLHAWDKYGLERAQEVFERRYDAKDRHPGSRPRFEDVLWGRISYISMVRGHSDLIARRCADQFENLKRKRHIDYGINYLPPIQSGSASGALARKELVTVMFTDIVESTLTRTSLGDAAWREKRQAHDRHIRSQLRRHGGTEIKTLGDGFLATLQGPTDAIHCALAIVEVTNDLLPVRIGLHAGEVEQDGNDIDGLVVVIAKRVMDCAGASEVLVSSTVKELVIGGAHEFTSIGLRRLKGVEDRLELFAVERSESAG
jgi:RNA-directed DNA polymerase